MQRDIMLFIPTYTRVSEVFWWFFELTLAFLRFCGQFWKLLIIIIHIPTINSICTTFILDLWFCARKPDVLCKKCKEKNRCQSNHSIPILQKKIIVREQSETFATLTRS